MMPAKSIIKKTIEVNKHMFELEIYPRHSFLGSVSNMMQLCMHLVTKTH